MREHAMWESKGEPGVTEAVGGLGRKVVVELVGTFFLALVVCSVSGSAGPAGPLAAGAILAAMLLSGGDLSAGHYNPAVSLALFIRRRLDGRHAVAFVAAQLAAGLSAAAIARSLYDIAPVARSADWRTALVECLFTLALTLVVLNVSALPSGEGDTHTGLAIGAIVAAGAISAGGLSIGAFNPAVALTGPASGRIEWQELWIYWPAETLGCVMAVLVFLVIAKPFPTSSGAPPRRTATLDGTAGSR